MTETADSVSNGTQGTAMINGNEVSAKSKSSSGRLVSLDALRGVDMFWILGGTTLVAQLLDYFKLSSLGWVRPQLEHGTEPRCSHCEQPDYDSFCPAGDVLPSLRRQ